MYRYKGGAFAVGMNRITRNAKIAFAAVAKGLGGRNTPERCRMCANGIQTPTDEYGRPRSHLHICSFPPFVAPKLAEGGQGEPSLGPRGPFSPPFHFLGARLPASNDKFTNAGNPKNPTWTPKIQPSPSQSNLVAHAFCAFFCG